MNAGTIRELTGIVLSISVDYQMCIVTASLTSFIRRHTTICPLVTGHNLLYLKYSQPA